MLKTTLIAAGVLALATGPTLAQPANGMTLTQFQTERADRMFLRLDTNKDGKITGEELKVRKGDKGDKRHDHPKRHMQAKRELARMDADKDRVITRAEASAALAERFKRRDVNNDGVLSQEELRAKGDKAKVGV
ncbi:EF-hand domain-containing protein [Caulobacter vibrioides]|uniref:EF hand domain protein n=2 Tax=Caulobacter vibrioides TaxID=155892 RepID=Q9A4S8_CAUVC|nr:EF-hand domain-containing protein [Caulobacter vibrioides]YP_002518211.1 EF hand domain protein [Caulobacter vibrioides NA1000]AAK24716.1 EF hand domain protein [Caulobacter vibrioides CB15]ACL96303.1 EF hand domain protein [Caulobacter vibrioides NA1000]ATC29587.1 calcium-binding protein [Caulobacter vibrioides]QXZ51107.1 EF-hand domain-containing protein [Caulobacter vibrioides]